ncbi:hypothetical protein V7S57_02520 [Caulobacter sp. CCNWLY153]|uniref:hypothetical protein n=1 Tax=unclassified Caulobacter TaxID=2648921 RepID=UPI002FF2DDF7
MSLEPLCVQDGGCSTDGADPEQVRALGRRVLRPLRERAKALGYALAAHGSQERDIDLVAIPWTARACSPEALANSLRQVLSDLYVIRLEIGPEATPPKPHGRLCWSFWIQSWTYIDLSVMPPTVPDGEGAP